MTTRSHITVLLDRTGSMASIRDDVIGGFNSFLSEQQAAPEPGTLTLVQFDSQDPYEVLHIFAPLHLVHPLDTSSYVEFNRAQVSRMIQARQEAGWEFIFLSADLAAFDDVQSMGMRQQSSLLFGKHKRGNDAAWSMASTKIRERRAGMSEAVEFNDVERKSAE